MDNVVQVFLVLSGRIIYSQLDRVSDPHWHIRVVHMEKNFTTYDEADSDIWLFSNEGEQEIEPQENNFQGGAQLLDIEYHAEAGAPAGEGEEGG